MTLYRDADFSGSSRRTASLDVPLGNPRRGFPSFSIQGSMPTERTGYP